MNKLVPYGMAAGKYGNLSCACGEAYANKGKLIRTPFVFLESPYNNKVLQCKNVFEIGCGVGRNIMWWMENTNANYFSVEPNPYMRQFVTVHDPTCNKLFFPEWKKRVNVVDDFEGLPKPHKFDVVISTYVFQHLGYRNPTGVMNIDEITSKIKEFTDPGTIWILIEHEREEPGWIAKWLHNNGFGPPDLFIKDYKTCPELLYRGLHHLIITQQK
jgi:SAM-dependent methyltransferase